MFSRSVIALAAVLFTQTALAVDCTRQYTVKAGDTCDAISSAQNVSTYQLAAVNPTINNACSNLDIGQVLCLGTSEADCKKTHVVVPNDICDSVSSTYAINSTLLWANNPQLDAECSNLYIGEVVCVDSAYNVPSLAPGQPKPSNPPDVTPATPTTSTVPISVKATATPTPTPAPEDEDDLPWCEEGDDGY